MCILILKDGVQFNLTEEEVRQRLAKKLLSLSDKASCEGSRDWWIPLGEVLEFIATKRKERPSEPNNDRHQTPPPSRPSPRSLDHYTTLGVSRDSSQDVIKAAYRLRMQEYHPDKVAHLGPELRALAERKTKEINEAYQTLRH